MAKKKGSSQVPSQVHVPCARRFHNEAIAGGMNSTSIQGDMVTPNRESIGTKERPVPTELGGAEFLHETHHASGATRRGK